MAPINKEGVGSEEQDFARVVELHYAGLYRFAFTLTRNEADACDLTQQTFYVWAAHGGRLREPSKVKSWLFTTLYRDFLKTRRKRERFLHQELSEVEDELPSVPPAVVSQMDWQTLMNAFGQVDEVFQAPLALFYLEGNSYQEIAEVLQVPIGTVMSRIYRGRSQLQAILLRQQGGAERKVIPFPGKTKETPRG